MKLLDVLYESLPPDWDAAQFDSPRSLEQSLAYAKSKAAEIGRGASRTVFRASANGRPVAVKVASTEGGVISNRTEIKLLTNNTIRRFNCTIPIIGFDQSPNPVWIVMELASPASDEDFKSLTGGSLEDLMNYVTGASHPSDDIFAEPEPVPTQTDKHNEWVKQFKQFCDTVKHITSVGEFYDLRNWGMLNNRPVVVDLGMTYIAHAGLLDQTLDQL